MKRLASIRRRRAPRLSRHTVAALLGATLALPVGGAGASGDAAAGQEKSASCAACHGAAGESAGPQWPILAGQYASYLEHALESYRSGSRQNAIMQGFAAPLSDEDIEDLAAWFASQSGPLRTAPRGY